MSEETNIPIMRLAFRERSGVIYRQPKCFSFTAETAEHAEKEKDLLTLALRSLRTLR